MSSQVDKGEEHEQTSEQEAVCPVWDQQKDPLWADLSGTCPEWCHWDYSWQWCHHVQLAVTALTKLQQQKDKKTKKERNPVQVLKTTSISSLKKASQAVLKTQVGDPYNITASDARTTGRVMESQLKPYQDNVTGSMYCAFNHGLPTMFFPLHSPYQSSGKYLQPTYFLFLSHTVPWDQGAGILIKDYASLLEDISILVGSTQRTLKMSSHEPMHDLIFILNI